MRENSIVCDSVLQVGISIQVQIEIKCYPQP
jgi:hypothetical protein